MGETNKVRTMEGKGSRTRPWITVLLGGALVACGPDTSPVPSVVVRDSAGVRIAENASVDSAGVEVWTLDPRPVLEIGAEEEGLPEQQLYGVGDVLILENGRIVVVNEGLINVLLFDSDGAFLGAIGGRGEGPGEFQRIEGVYRCTGDTVVVNGFGTASVFDSNTKHARSERLVPLPPDGAALRLQGVSSDCSRFLLRGGYEIPAQGEIGLVSYHLFWGTLDNAIRDTVDMVLGWEAETLIVDGGVQPLPLAWGRWGKWASDGDNVYVATSEHPEIRVFDRDAQLTRIIRWWGGGRAVTRDDHTLYGAKRNKWGEIHPQVADAFPDLEVYSALPSQKPALLSLLIDDEGNLWVREYPNSVAGRPDLYDYSNPDAPLRENPTEGQTPERWMVFDPGGRFSALVEIPADLAVRSVHSNKVVGIWRDELDVERIRIHRLVKHPDR